MTLFSKRSSKLVPSRAAVLMLLLGASLNLFAAEAIDFTEIAREARFASAAYQSEAQVRALTARENYALTLFHTVSEIQMTFYLATDDSSRSQVIAVRGTSNSENAMLDVAFKLMPDDKTGIRLHQGFAYAAAQIYGELRPLLKKDYRIRSTGHSLGGAVAQILAMYLDTDGFLVDRIVTFGQPKVTNIPGANRFQHLELLRVVTPTDVVPLVPPFDPLDIRNIDIYWHAGSEVILLEGKRYAILEGVDSMLRAANFTQQVPTEDNLNNHFMDIYIDLIAAKLESPERVSYRNNLNLFNIFGNDPGG